MFAYDAGYLREEYMTKMEKGHPGFKGPTNRVQVFREFELVLTWSHSVPAEELGE